VEDEMMAASMLELVLGECGCIIVGPVPSVETAMAMIEDGPIDAAILDVNLGGEPVFPVADKLAAIRVPFIFVTGYGVPGVDKEKYPGVPIVQKPYDENALLGIVANQLMERRVGP
jgi:DNA-binding NtrC family response regulator